MNEHNVLEKYIELCHSTLYENERMIAMLKSNGIYERFIFENFNIVYSDGKIFEFAKENKGLNDLLDSLGILINTKDIFKNHIIIPIYNENKVIESIVGYNIYPQAKNKMILLNDTGIFNHSFLSKAEEIIFTDNPLEALLLIQNDYPHVTFTFGSDNKFSKFVNEHSIKKAVFTFEGKMRLFYELNKNGVSAKRVAINFNELKNGNSKTYLETVFKDDNKVKVFDDTIIEIENGFLFSFPHLKYRVIGNFKEYTMNIRCNIKAYTQDEVFVDSLDLYKNRDRQNFIYNLLDKFGFRDQIQLESDLNQIMQVIEKHRERNENEKKKSRPELTEYQKEIGLKFL